MFMCLCLKPLIKILYHKHFTRNDNNLAIKYFPMFAINIWEYWKK